MKAKKKKESFGLFKKIVMNLFRCLLVDLYAILELLLAFFSTHINT